MKKIKDIFIEGPINPIFVAESITKHTVKTTIGGHSIFLGQIREDMIDKKKVQAIHCFWAIFGIGRIDDFFVRRKIIANVF